MTVTAKARAKLTFYWTMLVGTLIIIVIRGAVTGWSLFLRLMTLFSVLYLGLLIVAHPANRRSGRYDPQP